MTIAVPRDRAGTFEPVIVKKRQRRLSDVDAVAISLFAKGLTTGEISAHFHEVCGASISKDTVSRITDKVLEEMAAWSSRPLQPVYAAIFIDAIYVKVRDGQVGNQPFYAAIGVDLNGRRDVLGLWAGQGGGESAKFWMNVLADLKNRGVRDVFFIVCDGLKGLPDSVNAVFPQAIVQACVIHLIRATLRYASRKYWDQLAKDLRRIYTAPSVEAAWAAFEELEEKWGKPYPAIPKMWRAAWEEFIPFLAYDVEIRRVLFSTDEIVKGKVAVEVAGGGVASGRRGSRRPVRLVRRRWSQPVVGFCRCRPRRAGGGCRASMGRLRRVRACVVCA